MSAAEAPPETPPLYGYFYRTAYLIWPRALMEAMPHDWQARFVQLASEIDAEFAWPKGKYTVIVAFTDEDGEPFQKVRNHDPLRNYARISPAVIDAHRTTKL